MGKLTLSIVIASVILILIAVVVLVVTLFTVGPRLYFYTGSELVGEGIVLLDSEELGLIKEGHVTLPRQACKEEHTITLKINNEDHEFAFYPIDCAYGIVNYTISKERVTIEKSPDNIVLRFLISETRQPAQGNLYIDNELKEMRNGEITLSKEACKKIKTVTLSHLMTNSSWDGPGDLCTKRTLLEYPVLEEQFN
jgi:hypothetical protein